MTGRVDAGDWCYRLYYTVLIRWEICMPFILQILSFLSPDFHQRTENSQPPIFAAENVVFSL